MAELFPFRGHRYNGEKVRNLLDVVTQPYDKISPEMRHQYLERHPCNIIRVIKNEDYAQAARYLRDWIQEGVLVEDRSPSLYPYEQRFDFEGETLSRTGLIGLISLEDKEFKVRGHERVLDSPLEDRLRLIRSTEANEGLIFMLYSDPERTVDRILAEFQSGSAPCTDIVDESEVSHRLWQIQEAGIQKKLSRALADLSLYIADGHHRFKSSQLFCAECREKGWRPGDQQGFDKRMVALFNMDSPGLRILPTHRGIRNLRQFDLTRLLAALQPHFETIRVDGVGELLEGMKGEGIRIGMATGKPRQHHLILLRDASGEASDFMPGVEGQARTLDVTVLHEGILGPCLGIGKAELASQSYVDYFRSRDELLEQVDRGGCQAGFLLNPTTLEQVREISESGYNMPQKSTDFYPKLLTGLVLMKMKIEKS